MEDRIGCRIPIHPYCYQFEITYLTLPWQKIKGGQRQAAVSFSDMLRCNGSQLKVAIRFFLPEESTSA